jgi:hypothetical protein
MGSGNDMSATLEFCEIPVRAFDPSSRCPYCGGSATFRFHRPAQGCYEMLEPHSHRRCLECEYSWPEAPPHDLISVRV